MWGWEWLLHRQKSQGVKSQALPQKSQKHRQKIARWESAKVSHKRVFALLMPEIHSYEMAQMLQKPVFALPGCQRTSVNTLLCDTLALADQNSRSAPGITTVAPGRSWCKPSPEDHHVATACEHRERHARMPRHEAAIAALPFCDGLLKEAGPESARLHRDSSRALRLCKP